MKESHKVTRPLTGVCQNYIKYCKKYLWCGSVNGIQEDFEFHKDGHNTVITEIKCRKRNEKERLALTAMLEKCKPLYEFVPREDFVVLIEEQLGIPVRFVSYGPTRDDVKDLFE